MAEILSCNLNKVIIETIGQHSLERVPLMNTVHAVGGGVL
jgi:hypothetical protein